MVPSWADQPLPQLLMEQFDTFTIQCRHIEHMHEGVWFRKNYFCQNDSCENLDNLKHMHGVWFRKNIFCQNDSCENLDNFP